MPQSTDNPTNHSQPTGSQRAGIHDMIPVQDDAEYGQLVRQVTEKVLKLLKEELRRDLERRGGK